MWREGDQLEICRFSDSIAEAGAATYICSMLGSQDLNASFELHSTQMRSDVFQFYKYQTDRSTLFHYTTPLFTRLSSVGALCFYSYFLNLEDKIESKIHKRDADFQKIN